MKAKISIVLLILALASVGQAVAQQIIYDTYTNPPSPWNGIDNVSPFGNGQTPTYGETIVSPNVPTGNQLGFLHSFSFYLTGSAGDTATVQANVFAWSGGLHEGEGGYVTSPSTPLFQTVTGPYTMQGNDGGGHPIYTAVTLNIPGPGVSLPFNEYALLLTIAQGVGVGTSRPVAFGLAFSAGDRGTGTNNAIAGDGGFIYANGASSAWGTAGDWGPGGGLFDQGDLAFKAVFGTAAVSAPEPGSLVMAGGGLIGLLALAWRRRKNRQSVTAIAS